MKIIALTVAIVLTAFVILLILAPKKHEPEGLKQRGSNCDKNHGDSTETGLCERCGLAIGW